MSDTKYVIDRGTLVGIADAIRGKDGSTGAIAVTRLAQKITDIPSGSTVVHNSGSVYGNGTRYMSFEHGLGVTPQFVKLKIDDSETHQTNSAVEQEYCTAPYGTIGTLEYHSTSATSTSKGISSPRTVNDTIFEATSSSSNRPWLSGVKYNWEAWAGYDIESTSTQSYE